MVNINQPCNEKLHLNLYKILIQYSIQYIYLSVTSNIIFSVYLKASSVNVYQPFNSKATFNRALGGRFCLHAATFKAT